MKMCVMCGRQHKRLVDEIRSLIVLFIFLALISLHFSVHSYSTWVGSRGCAASCSIFTALRRIHLLTYFVSLYACEKCVLELHLRIPQGSLLT